MTEKEWLECEELSKLVSFLNRPLKRMFFRPWHWLQHPRRAVSLRKLRLLACASCRKCLPMMKGEQRLEMVIEVNERFADGIADLNELLSIKELVLPSVNKDYVQDDVLEEIVKRLVSTEVTDLLAVLFVSSWPACIEEIERSFNRIMELPDRRFSRESMRHLCAICDREASRLKCELTRDIVGSPFGPNIVVGKTLLRADNEIHAVAKTIYKQNEWQKLSELADALEQSGCQQQPILAIYAAVAPMFEDVGPLM